MKLPLRFVFVAALAVMLYKWSLENPERVETFVPYNSTEPSFLSADVGQLVAAVNGTDYAISYHMEDLKGALETMINTAVKGMGEFKVMTIGETQPFTLTDVLLRDSGGSHVRLKRVDFVVSSVRPFVIQKAILVPDTAYSTEKAASEGLVGVPPHDNRFLIKNPLHLFYPYETSDNEMAISLSDQDAFNAVVSEKALLSKGQVTGETTTYSTPYTTVSTSTAPGQPIIVVAHNDLAASTSVMLPAP